MTTPYRPLPVVQQPREISVCPWCWHRGDRVNQGHPTGHKWTCTRDRRYRLDPVLGVVQTGDLLICTDENSAGECEHYSPTWQVRFWRRFGFFKRSRSV